MSKNPTWSESFYQTFREKNNFKPEDRLTSGTETLLQTVFSEAGERLRQAGIDTSDKTKTHNWLIANKVHLRMGQMLTDSFAASNGIAQLNGAPAHDQPSNEQQGEKKRRERKPKGSSGSQTPVVVDEFYARFAESWYLKAAAEQTKKGGGILPETVKAELQKICQDFGQRMGGKPLDLKQYRNSFSIPLLNSPHHTILMRGFDQVNIGISSPVNTPPAPAAS